MIQTETHIRIGSRYSPLAVIQVDELLGLLNSKGISVSAERKVYETRGDKDQKSSLLSDVGGDFFTDELDKALLSGEIDVAVHSAKDLPEQLPDGLTIYALTASEDSTDAFVGECQFKDLPKGARIGTSSFLRQKSVKALRPDVQIVDIRGTIEQRLKLINNDVCDGVIVASIALKRLHLQDKITEVMPWEGFPLQGQLAVVGRKSNSTLRDLFSNIDVRIDYGKVVLIGAGPGDPELLTIKAVKALHNADVVLYDYLVDKSVLNHAPQAEWNYVGKRKGKHSLLQEDLNRQMKDLALAGKNVARLKGGDPLIFGRGTDELRYLQNFHIQTDIVPGVSSATGLLSRIGIPLTARGISSSAAFLSAHVWNNDHSDYMPIQIPNVDTLVFFMGLTKVSEIVQALRESGRAEDLPMMIISQGSMHKEHIIESTLGEIEKKSKQEDIKPPALIIAGNTLKLSTFLNRKSNITWLYTGSQPKSLGIFGQIIHFPMIQIEPIELSEEDKDRLFTNFSNSDMILFTSRYSVECLDALIDFQDNKDLLSNKEIYSIGPATTEALLQRGIRLTKTSLKHDSYGLWEMLAEQNTWNRKNVLFPRSNLSNPFLQQRLEETGAKVHVWPVYENRKPDMRKLPTEDVDGVIFTSPSTVDHFLNDYKRLPGHWMILAKGVKTQQHLKVKGFKSQVIL